MTFFDSIRRSGFYLGRSRMLGGVCAGLSERTGWDLALIRCAVAIFSVCCPLFIISLYGLAWILLPRYSDGQILLENALDGTVSGQFIGAVTMIVAGLIYGAYILRFTGPFTLIILTILFTIALVFIWNYSRQQMNGRGYHQQPQPQPQHASAFAAQSNGNTWQQHDPRSQPHTPHDKNTRDASKAHLSDWIVIVVVIVIVTITTVFTTMFGGFYLRFLPDSVTPGQVVLFNGGLCLLITGLALLVAALSKRQPLMLIALSLIGLLVAIPTAQIGIQRADYYAYYGSASSSTYSHNSSDTHSTNTEMNHPKSENDRARPSPQDVEIPISWKQDSFVSDLNSAILDLTDAPQDTHKTIFITDVRGTLTVKLHRDQPVRFNLSSSVRSIAKSPNAKSTTSGTPSPWRYPIGANSSPRVFTTEGWSNKAEIVLDLSNISTLSIYEAEPEKPHSVGSPQSFQSRHGAQSNRQGSADTRPKKVPELTR